MSPCPPYSDICLYKAKKCAGHEKHCHVHQVPFLTFFYLLKKYQFDKSILLNNLIITTYELVKTVNITYFIFLYYITIKHYKNCKLILYNKYLLYNK